MLDSCLGDQVIDLVRKAKHEVVIIAPFIKVNAIERILECISVDKVRFNCVTRWIAADIAAGVCDIEIYDLIERVPEGRLWMNERLHAKYVRADKKCLTGSANITESALGWRVPSNLELMVDTSSKFEELKLWEKSVFNFSTVVDHEMRDALQNQVSMLIKKGKHMQYVEFQGDDHINENWVPLYASPSKLYGIYSKQLTTDNIVESSYKLAIRDLGVLGLPTGLSEVKFNQAVASQIRTLKVVVKILDASEKAKNVGISVSDIEEIVGSIDNISDNRSVAQRLTEWIGYFFAEEYVPEVGTVRLIKARKI